MFTQVLKTSKLTLHPLLQYPSKILILIIIGRTGHIALPSAIFICHPAFILAYCWFLLVGLHFSAK